MDLQAPAFINNDTGVNCYYYFICFYKFCIQLCCLVNNKEMRLNIFFSRFFFILIVMVQVFIPLNSYPDIYHSEYPAEYNYNYNTVSIKTVNGRFYAYIVLLFNSNPHFVNLISKGTISLKDKEIDVEGFYLNAYKNYLKTIRDNKLLEESELILKVFLAPDQFNDAHLKKIENSLARRNIILKFYREGVFKGAQITLDYCIYGEKIKIDIKHPLFDSYDEMYYIKPYIYYDEISTSNSTFYYDMIYINPDEVNNDFVIAKNIVSGKDVRSMFFVGSKVNDDIKQCLLMAFKDISSIKSEMWKMFVIHELTHKILNNQYNNYDQISGEELALSSTVYSNPYLGLSVMYSYLNYGKMTPHRMAAVNYINFIADASGNRDLINNPSHMKNINIDKLKEYTKNHFYSCVNKLKLNR